MKKVILSMLLLAVSALSGGCSCESYYAWKDMGPVPESIASKAFWSKECKAWAAPLKKADPSQSGQEPELAGEPEPHVVTRTYPSQYAVKLEKMTPTDVQLGDAFDYSIKVTNLTDMPLEDVVVMERIPNGFNFTGASPQADKEGSTLTWKLGSLAPKANEQITVSGFATSAGSLTNRATVTIAVPAQADVRVLQAVLQIVKTAPDDVLLCEFIPVKYVITNTGNGSGKGITIVEALPEGLLTEVGKDRVSFDVGTLDPGQSKELTATLKATRASTYTSEPMATASVGFKLVTAPTTTVVRQPVLSVSKEGPSRQYVERPITYEITVANTGDGEARNTTLEDTIPPGVTSITVSDNGQVSGSKATWKLGNIAPNHYKKVNITYTLLNLGELSSSATATAYCATNVSATAQTAVVGVPAILLEVIDVGDPVEVGGEGTYIITATNQGSTPATNIRVVCEFEDKVKCVSLSGATSGTVEGNVITFTPLAALAPRTKAIWRVLTRAEKAGDVLFKVSVTTDEFARPIEETESTNLYE
jgi:uncharacterized repeat protein (TIGR01451 family)